VSIPIRNADPSQICATARTFFVTSSIAGKRKPAPIRSIRALFIQTPYDYRAPGKFRLDEFVVMPDHFHVLITVDRNMTIARAVQFVKGGLAFRAGRKLGFRAPVWQKGFPEVRIHDAEGFQAVTKYNSEQSGGSPSGH
jgi:putative transposase